MNVHEIKKINELSERIETLINDREFLPTSDYQACMEAIIMDAISYGRQQNEYPSLALTAQQHANPDKFILDVVKGQQ
jgi:hypothetical protein